MVVVEYIANEDSVARFIDRAGSEFEYLFLMDSDSDEEMRHCMAAMLRWCEEFIGSDSKLWIVVARFRCIAFSHQSDAFAFRLRWC